MSKGLDWHSAPLEDDTVIDAGYRNTQNVRRYFKAKLGDDFKMNRPFMAWMKSNTGETMATACVVWKELIAKDKT
ncbi:MAG: DUF6434 domain-containing protein [Arenibacterium sp.]